MNNILNYVKPLVDEICKHKDEFTINITPETIRIIEYFDDEDWTITHEITLSNGFFNVSIDYGFKTTDAHFETVKEAVDFIFN